MKFISSSRLKLLTCILIFVASLSVSVFAYASGNLLSWNSTSRKLLNGQAVEPPVYPVNEQGLTYGSVADAYSYETEPDLIAAVGEGGIDGYVYADDLRGPVPTSPEEVLAIMNARGEGPRTIPLYKSDGRTVIGEFLVSPGVALYEVE